jgi:hypothetical protein
VRLSTALVASGRGSGAAETGWGELYAATEKASYLWPSPIGRLHHRKKRRLGCVSCASTAAPAIVWSTPSSIAPGIDQLVAWGWLDRGDRTNRAAVEEAFNNFMIRAFEQARYL